VSFPAALCYYSREGSQQHSAGGALSYDPNNVFARILRGELPCRKVYEDEHVLAFHDIRPQAPTHIVVIPKGQYISVDDFSQKASDAEVAAFIRAIGHVAQQEGVSEDGYRILANHGAAAHQEVPHFHLHLFGGRDLGPMLRRPQSP
jgi:histidine triad (HIT) family protein